MLIVSNRTTDHTQYFTNPEALESYLKHNPGIQKILFVFWSWIVPSTILNQYECYGMHTGPLLEGKGRGGDPIGNLQRLGVKITTVCVFKMTDKLDGGPVKLAIPMWIDNPKDVIVGHIDECIPEIEAYLTAEAIEIPEVFRRADVKS